MNSDMFEAIALAEGFCNAIQSEEFSNKYQESKLVSDAIEIRDAIREAFKCVACGEFTVHSESVAQSLTAIADGEYNMNWVDANYARDIDKEEGIYCDKCYENRFSKF